MEATPTLHRGQAKSFTISPLLGALVLIALLTVVRATGSVDSDVAWQLWIAGRLHAGARLYRDIIEVNPPLWFWLARPADTLARLFGLRPETVLVWQMGSLVGLCVAATDQLLGSMSVARRGPLLCYAAFLLLVLPWVHVGQREQIVLVTTLPYAALVAARRQAKEVQPFLSAAIGLAAALGFALKHYFLLAPAALELWLFLCLGGRWRVVRPETVAMALSGALYACATLLWSSAYITDVIPLISLAYGGVGAPSIIDTFGPFTLIALLILSFVAAHVRLFSAAKAPLSAALFICAAAFVAAYFLQAKGWAYHAIPMLGCASLSLAAMIAETGSPGKVLRIASPALLLLPLALGIEEFVHRDTPTLAVSRAVADLKPGESVGFLASDNAIPWSVTLQHRFRFPSRYMSFWMLNAVVRNELRGNPNPRLEALGRRVVSETVQDFRCAPPQRLVVARAAPGEGGFDTLAFFLRDPAFAEMMKNYKARNSATLQAWDRVGKLRAPDGPCRQGV